MNYLKLVAGMLTLAGATTPAVSAAQDLLPDPPHQAQVEEAQLIGAMLFGYDQAAWHATDSLVEDLQENDSYDSSWLRGFLVFKGEGGQLDAVFYGEQDGALLEGARYQIEDGAVTGGGLLEDAERAPLSAQGIRMAQARDAAFAGMAQEEFPLCADANPNTVIFPPDENGNIAVYVLTPMISNEEYPLGGHYRFMINPDGEISDSRRFLNSCLAAPLGQMAGEERATGFVASHLLDPHPTEVHFFVSYYLPMSLYVATADSNVLWLISQGQQAGALSLDDLGLEN